MANKNGQCLICDSSPTVKAHIIPRAVMLDIRASSKSLTEGSRHSPGYKLLQNGRWDDTILCSQHENIIGAGDDYAVRFLRKCVSGARSIFGGKGFEIDNPRPDLLMHFIYATVWREAVSRNGKELQDGLGRYEPVLRDALLNQGPYDLQALVGFSGLGLKEVGKIDLAIPPYRTRIKMWNVWHFVLAHVQFHLVTDRRRLPADWKPYLANDNHPITLTSGRFLDVREAPSLRPILKNMLP